MGRLVFRSESFGVTEARATVLARCLPMSSFSFSGIAITRCLRLTALFVCLAVFSVGRVESVHAAAGGDASHHEHIGEKGVERNPAEFRSDLAIFTLVVFVILLTLLRTFAWKPIVTALDQRESRIRNDLSATEAARTRAEQLVAEHEQRMSKVQEEVKEILAEARRDAEQTRQDIVATAQREADAIKDRSIHEIQRARDQALQELFDQMSQQVVGATEHVLARALTDDDRNRFVGEALAQFTSSSGN